MWRASLPPHLLVEDVLVLQLHRLADVGVSPLRQAGVGSDRVLWPVSAKQRKRAALDVHEQLLTGCPRVGTSVPIVFRRSGRVFTRRNYLTY